MCKNKKLFAAYFFLSLLLVITISCTRKTKIHPSVENISESVYASGIVKSKNQYQVFSAVNGLIKEIYIKEGDLVNRTTQLMKLTNNVSAINVQNARLTAEYAQVSSNEEKLNELKMSIDLANAKLISDSLLWQRQKSLWALNVGTRVELEQRELAYHNSDTNYKTAKIHYRDLQRQLTLNARQSQNNLLISNTVADDYIIKSEVSGKVYNLLKKQGELVNNQSPVAIIGDDKTFLLELQVDEYDITRVKKGQKILIRMDSYKGQLFEAIVSRINPIMNERSKSFIVEADFITPPELLYPFLTVEANIVIRTKEKALTIPRAYLIDESYVLTEGNKKIKVTTGLMDYQKVEILSGLSQNDFILKPNL